MDTASDPVVLSLPQQRRFGDGDGEVFPLVLSPPCKDFDLFAWLSNRTRLDSLLRKHHAVFFRGFEQLDSHQAFHSAVEATGYQGMDYLGGAAVRTQLTARVFTANESPSSERIPFHHEMAQTPHPPTHLFFFCDVSPLEGGQTPILLSFEVYDALQAENPEEMSEVERVGVRYVRVLSEDDDPTSAIGRGWKSTFLCKSREEAEDALRKLGSSFEWLEGGDLRTVSAALPAVRVDAHSGRKVFFNSLVAAFLGWNDKRNVGEQAVQLGDGRALSPSFLRRASQLMEDQCVALPWQRGDLLLLDNRTAMHSRRPFEGPRRILASLARDPER